MFCCCSKKSSLSASIAGASLIIGSAAVSSGLLSDDKPGEAMEAALVSEAVYGAWDGKATGDDLPPEGEAFVLELSAGQGGGIVGTLTTTNFGGFSVTDGAFDEAEKVFSCTIVSQDDPNATAGLVAVVEGDAMVGAVSTPETEYEMTAARRKN